MLLIAGIIGSTKTQVHAAAVPVQSALEHGTSMPDSFFQTRSGPYPGAYYNEIKSDPKSIRLLLSYAAFMGITGFILCYGALRKTFVG